MKLSMHDAIVAALLARGEKQLQDGTLSKYEKYTRTWLVKREPDGSLKHRPPESGIDFYYVPRRSHHVRVGRQSTKARSLNPELIVMLVDEGRKVHEANMTRRPS